MATLTLDPPTLDDVAIGDDEFALDLRVVESTTPVVITMCSTSDGCGSTCSTSACSTYSSDPV